MPERPLVVHIITRLEPGGSSRNTVDSCAAQLKDFDVVLLAGPHPGSAPLLKLLPPDAIFLQVENLRRDISPLRDAAALLELTRVLRRLKPDIVHTHTSKAGALGRLAARLAGLGRTAKPLVIHTPHGHLLYGYYGRLKTFLFRAAERFLARFCDRLVALTPGEMRESIAAGIGTGDKWRVIHSGVDFTPPTVPARKADLGASEDEVTIGTVARLERVKGVEHFIRAAGLLLGRRPDLPLKFIVIGGGALEKELRLLAADLAGPAVVFTGFRPGAPALAAALDIYVQPSLNEAMGRAPLEAQALGIPVVVTRVCGLPDIIREGDTGFTVPPADPEALALVLERLASDKAMRSRMGTAARRWAMQEEQDGLRRFGAESMTRELSSFYNELLQDGEIRRNSRR